MAEQPGFDMKNKINEMLMSSPDLYPINMDFNRRVIEFVLMSRQSYRQSSFLDGRAASISSEKFQAGIDEVLSVSSTFAESQAASPCYVLHGAFCCSTLLARYLDLVDACFVLKEPALLTQLAVSRPFSRFDDEEKLKEWEDLLNHSVRLLTRTYENGQRVIIKGNDQCTFIADALLDRDPGAKVLFLHTDLSTFLASVLKSAERRAWVRTRFKNLRKHMAMLGRLGEIDTVPLTDSEAASYLWLLYAGVSAKLAKRAARDRFLSMDGNQIAEAPEQSLSAIARFFNLGLDHAIPRLLADPSVSRYSKHQVWRYNASSRRTELARLAQQYAVEIRGGMDWAHKLLATA